MLDTHSIVISNLSKHYRGTSQDALRAINLKISSGEVFGLLGPNGAGKTTFFSILCGLIYPSDGEVSLAGMSIASNLKSIKQIIGVVPQEIALYPTLSGEDNLLFIGRMYGLKGTKLKERVQSCLDDFGFDQNRRQAVKNYSGGMKRKINLIAGILHQPKVLLLDEPTVGIDVHARKEILAQLRQLNQQEGTTIIYTSHHMEEAEQFCDRVAIIDEGQLITTGVPETMVSVANCRSLEELFLQHTGKKIRD
ncbi:ABC transporter ATP-binding protein [Reichenbachiella agariperforans]|nr:ABC transporter ATP-binding protein [Reichenbachiella agariperforans]